MNFFAGTKNMDIGVMSDAKSFGCDEDGELIGLVYYVVAEEANGTRYRHEVSFPQFKKECVWIEEDSAELVMWVQTDAAEQAERLAERCRASDRINLLRWSEIDARYGSNAYASNGTEAFRAWQERQAA